MSHKTRTCMAALIGLAVGCGQAAPEAAPRESYSGPPPAVSPQPVAEQAPPLQSSVQQAACPFSGSTRACTCEGGEQGHQTCSAETWSVCNCIATGTDDQPIAGGGAGPNPSGPQTVVPSAPPEEPPTGVSFEWPETDPSRAVPCEPGHYVGMFSCDLYIVSTEGDRAFRLSGTIDMQLEQSMDGEILRIADGKFFSASAGAIPSWGDIVGELDCSSGRFDGRLENGKFSVALGLPVPFTEGTFEGDLSADYDGDTLSLENGLWDMAGQLDGFPGSCMGGTWTAMHVPVP